jgi:hypothetical protein
MEVRGHKAHVKAVPAPKSPNFVRDSLTLELVV